MYVIQSFIVQFSFFTSPKISASFKAQGGYTLGQDLCWAERQEHVVSWNKAKGYR